MTDPVAIVPDGMETYVKDWQMSPGLFAGEFLFLTGMTGAGPGGTAAANPDVQIALAFDRVAAVLSEAGLGFEDVVEMTSYHVDIKGRIDAFRRIRASYVQAPYPAWTAIEVSGFVTPGTICELRVIARRRTPNAR